MRSYHLPPVLPVIALVLMPFLSFVNSAGLWLGMPKMLVWGGFWCLMFTPALLLSERLLARSGEESR
ncbi:hypothetical protein [Amycolatopsis sp. PS_44_ISF1]|uniref:hypothetical protein n=1 Tax=Amycolatopsis sp. PS_44_ISF1 TaxID=2974917 RepID=UPI0028DF3456|nr:hypothetical protein [Amycolatopsis sp. PS_44_ISF1]MDT8914170.1 hypothetical protein [Amycolatopsis sp. PS_44_ISF1]